MTFDTLCCLLLHMVGVMERVVAHLTYTEESVALLTQTDKLLHMHGIQFLLEESDCLTFRNTIEGMVEGVLTEIVVSAASPATSI